MALSKCPWEAAAPNVFSLTVNTQLLVMLSETSTLCVLLYPYFHVGLYDPTEGHLTIFLYPAW